MGPVLGRKKAPRSYAAIRRWRRCDPGHAKVSLALTFFRTGLVPHFPTAILATGLMIVAFMSFMCGLILDTVVRGRREVRRLPI